MTEYARPDPAVLRRGAKFGQHVRPSRADDLMIERLVQAIFAPTSSTGWQPCDPRLVQQLLDRAPQPDQLGVDDWNRGLRADEIAEVWGAPMEGPDTRGQWLRRADEIARAWGQTLFGPNGLRPDITLGDDPPPATGNPAPSSLV